MLINKDLKHKNQDQDVSAKDQDKDFSVKDQDPGARRPCQVWRESVQRVAPAGRKTWFLACE